MTQARTKTTDVAANDPRVRLMQAFQAVLIEQKRRAYEVTTKEEEAEREEDGRLLETVADYTPDAIVRGLADLQLEFGDTVTSLADRLQAEADKQRDLQRATVIQAQQLEELRKVRTVADALYLLRQEQQERRRELNDTVSEARRSLELEMTQKRKAWEREQTDFDGRVAKESERGTATRQQEVANFDYERSRQRQIAADKFAQAQRDQTADLAKLQREKGKDWAEREQFLTDHQTEWDENREKAAGFEDELKAAFNKARDEAIAEVNRDAKVKADLVEKTWEAAQQTFEVEISTLQTDIERQTAQITAITNRLQEATQQARQLATQAFAKQGG
ncbi:MAG: hypothetical protein AAF889_11615 [Cyanobacteria bacterium P01_D01_bin.73]